MAASPGLLRPLLTTLRYHNALKNGNLLWRLPATAVLCSRSPPITLQCRGAKSVTGNVKTAAEEGDSAEETVDLSKVCSGLNYFQNGEDPPIRDDSDYPDWLRGILEPVKSPEELSPDSKAYWRRLNKQKARKNNFISKQLGRRKLIDCQKEKNHSSEIKQQPKHHESHSSGPSHNIFVSSLSGCRARDTSKTKATCHTKTKKAKNRLGQRSRQKIWEQQYGTRAKHMKKKPVGRRGNGPVVASARAQSHKIPVKQNKPQDRPKEEPLHPSWEASKRRKEQESKHTSFQGQRTVFSDSD